MDGKIGVFVRYSSRKANSLYKSPANCFIRLNNRKSDLQCFRDYIVKHSKNIIDLIEVGDYVNGYKITNKIDLSHNKTRLESGIYAINGEIKSIVTREQFAQAEYKVEEDK